MLNYNLVGSRKCGFYTNQPPIAYHLLPSAYRLYPFAHIIRILISDI